MKIIFGDLLKSNVPVIIHQCNCFHKMGAGIAKLLKDLYPEVYESDKRTVFGDKTKLGSFSYAEINNKDLKYVINLYSQYNYGKGIHTDYIALKNGLNNALKFIHSKSIKRVGIPYLIGCGLAGGDIDKVYSILEEVQEMNTEV